MGLIGASPQMCEMLRFFDLSILSCPFSSGSLAANLHDKLRRIALYHYADCRMQTALCTFMQYSAILTDRSLVATTGGDAIEARRRVPPQISKPGGTLWSVPPQILVVALGCAGIQRHGRAKFQLSETP